MKKRLLLDIDGVLCSSGYLELINEYLNTNYTLDDFDDYYIDKALIPEEQLNDFYEFIKNKDQYANPLFMPNAVETIKKLSEIYEIYPCSDCRNHFALEQSGRIFANKFNLLYRTFPQDIIPAKNYIFTGTKDLFNADVQIDDLVSNLTSNIPIKILFPSYHNKNVSQKELREKNIIKAGDKWQDGWQIIFKILLENN